MLIRVNRKINLNNMKLSNEKNVLQMKKTLHKVHLIIKQSEKMQAIMQFT